MIKINMADLPASIRGVTAVDDESGERYIVVNAGLTVDGLADALRHEIAHNELKHFSRTDSVAVIEQEASGWRKSSMVLE